MQKGFAPILIVLLIVLGISGYFVYTNYSNNEKISISQQRTQLNSSSDIETWRTYKNPKYRYSIKYPQYMVLNEDKNYPEYIYFDEQNFISISVSLDRPCQGDCGSEKIEKTEDVKIGNIDSKKYSGVTEVSRIAGYQPPQSFVRYEVKSNGYLYKLAIQELNTDYSYQNEEKYPADRKVGSIPADNLAIFDQMVSTFRVSDTVSPPPEEVNFVELSSFKDGILKWVSQGEKFSAILPDRFKVSTIRTYGDMFDLISIDSDNLKGGTITINQRQPYGFAEGEKNARCDYAEKKFNNLPYKEAKCYIGNNLELIMYTPMWNDKLGRIEVRGNDKTFQDQALKAAEQLLNSLEKGY